MSQNISNNQALMTAITALDTSVHSDSGMADYLLTKLQSFINLLTRGNYCNYDEEATNFIKSMQKVISDPRQTSFGPDSRLEIPVTDHRSDKLLFTVTFYKAVLKNDQIQAEIKTEGAEMKKVALTLPSEDYDKSIRAMKLRVLFNIEASLPLFDIDGRTNLQGATLPESGINIKDRLSTKISEEEINLDNTAFSRCNMRGAIFKDISIQNTIITDTEMDECNIDSCNLSGTELHRVSMQKAVVKNITMDDKCVMSSVKTENAVIDENVSLRIARDRNHDRTLLMGIISGFRNML